MSTKHCNQCDKDVSVNNFYKYKNGTLHSECKGCAGKRARKNQSKNRDRYTEYQRNWRSRGDNAEKDNARSLKYYHKNKDSISARRKADRKKNPEKHVKRSKKYYEQYGREYFKNRLANDLEYKTRVYLRSRLYLAVKK